MTKTTIDAFPQEHANIELQQLLAVVNSYLCNYV